MYNLIVSKHGDGDFSTIQDAVNAVKYETPAHIFIRDGIYREKLYCEKGDITLEGESQEGTLLVMADGATHFHSDGRPMGTFRSYTAFFSGKKITVQKMTIANTVGDGRLHGQGIAAAVDAENAQFFQVSMLGCQDTLFTGPLPEKERKPDGFLGPKQFSPRLSSRQYYRDCYIRGDVDFIFGGADALFENCTLHCRGRELPVNGWVAAPSTPQGNLGYVFYRCSLERGAAAPGSFFLARPWRPSGRAAFLWCDLGDVICPEGYDLWDGQPCPTCVFSEYGSTGDSAQGERHVGRCLSSQEAEMLLKRAVELRSP